ncbi:MAG: hypothetical protein ACHQ0J_01605 [Candidatus Dormibacterales bacterium]
MVSLDAVEEGDSQEASIASVPYPTLEALVSAAESDPVGVRKALESWIRLAPTPAAKLERRAHLHYWLYRAGDAGELEKLRTLFASNPALKEVGLFLRLAVQETDETWS